MEKEVKIEVGETQVYSLKEGQSQILSFEHNAKDKKEIQFISYTTKLSPFRMFVSREKNPSTQNTLTIIPSWMGGYYASASKKSVNWCENCTYYILLEAEKGAADITFTVKYEDTINKIKHIEPIWSSLTPGRMHCYSIEIEDSFKNENLIIETILFSGSAVLGMNSWSNPLVNTNDYSMNGFRYTDEINADNIRIVNPIERKLDGKGIY